MTISRCAATGAPDLRGRERMKTDGVKSHPTQKPEALLYRVLLACTNRAMCP